MRAGSGFRVILNRKGWPVFKPDSFYRVVIQINMRNLNILVVSYSFRIHSKAVILCGDLAFSGDDIFDRMI